MPISPAKPSDGIYAHSIRRNGVESSIWTPARRYGVNRHGLVDDNGVTILCPRPLTKLHWTRMQTTKWSWSISTPSLSLWCRPCKMISPILEKLTGDTNIKTGSGCSLDLVTVDTDKEFELAQKHQIRSLPTVMAFKDGKPINHFIGALSEGDVRKFIQQL
ncbi:thioredoxin-like protein [Boletus reticuloceps]|uniref:Thioredoxin-like protein n=1 Tax=Boletus reticuloceps TaxID=495285 RepID=A0A8I2YNZ3_9AGAM|nr:thioredoxin-like protein [Boletus reticuloceps]